MNMKKTILSVFAGFAAIALQAQVVTYVLAPAELEGPLEFTWAEPSSWGQTPDLNDPANRIEAPAVFGDDGTEADSLGCNALVNGADLEGKIAVIYRGACEFGLKALNAQNAGAIGVVIVNNAPGAIAMGAGANGGEVTIPVVMIGSVEGAMLRDEILAGNVELLIGSVLGVYEYNLFTTVNRVAMPTHTAMPSALANSGFSIPVGTWIRNLGSQAQADVSLSAVITQNDVEVYNETSSEMALGFDQEAFFTLPAFEPAVFSGGYTITYTVNSGTDDEFPGDNSSSFNFLADDLLAYSPIDLVQEAPLADEHYRAVDGLEDFMVCSYFRHPGSGQLDVHGLYGSLTMGGGASTEGELLEARIYEWNDDIGAWPEVTFDAVDLMEVADYFYEENLSGVPVYIPFATPYTMADNQRYLFCIYSPSATSFLGMGSSLSYADVQAASGDPVYVMGYGTTWGYFEDVQYSSVGAHMLAPVSVTENSQVETTPYPNPATDLIRIPLQGFDGAASLQVFDLAGNKVAEDRVSVGGELLTVHVGNYSNGVYIFQMNFDNGQHSTFRVVVTK